MLQRDGCTRALLFLILFTVESVLAASGTLLVVNKSGDSVSLLNLASGAAVSELPTGHGPHEVAIGVPEARIRITADPAVTLRAADHDVARAHRDRPRIAVALRRYLPRASRWLPALSGGFLLSAQKRVHPMTPLKPKWHTRRLKVVGGLVEPTTRSSHRRQYE